MAIDTTPSQVATSALQAIPFGSIIGAPLKACIEAQAMAAKSSWEFIQQVGLNTNKETGMREAINVSFNFMQNGRMAQLNVPLLTILPIPYIGIQNIDLNFKANISAASSSVTETSESSDTKIDGGGSLGLKIGPFHMQANMKANYSSKKDSKATQDSRYSVEYTMDVAVKAGQESMPAGLAKVLELLGSALDVSDPEGTLEVSERDIVMSQDGNAMLIATYKNPQGLYEPKAITVMLGNTAVATSESGNNAVVNINTAGEYVVKAGEKEIKINVHQPEAADKKPAQPKA